MRSAVVALVAVMLAVAGLAGGQRRRAVRTPGASWNSSLAADAIAVATIAGRPLFASSRLRVSWLMPSFAADHFVVTAVDAPGGLPLSFSASLSPPPT